MKNDKSDVNSSRQIIKIVGEICGELGIELKSYSFDWIIQLTLRGRNMFIYGYQFPSNDASAELICGDKAALASVLLGNGIQAVEHEYFMAPSNLHYTGEEGNWKRLDALLERWGKLVLKRNSGSGGSGVYIVANQTELERVAGEIFRSSRALSVSPYYDIIDEYRAVYCYGSPLLIYKKVRPCVTGDGKSSLAELTAIKYKGKLDLADERLDPASIPSEGEKVVIGWKHNLGQGATAEPVEKNSPLYAELDELACRAADCVNLNFASVDIVDTAGGKKVLEINSGIMMENFAAAGEDCYKTAKTIYRKAITNYFGIE